MVQALQGNSQLLQQHMRGIEKRGDSVSSTEAEAPADETYKSLACNDRLAEEGYIDILTSDPASAKHLHVPENAITHNTLQASRPHPSCRAQILSLRMPVTYSAVIASRVTGCQTSPVDCCAAAIQVHLSMHSTLQDSTAAHCYHLVL